MKCPPAGFHNSNPLNTARLFKMIRTLEIVWEHTPELAEIPVITTDTNKTFCELLKDLRPAFETGGYSP